MSKKVTFPIHAPKNQLRALEGRLSPAAISHLRKIVNREVAEARRHFKTDGWDLRVNYIVETVKDTMIGSVIDWYVLSRLLTLEAEIATGKDGVLVLSKKKAGK